VTERSSLQSAASWAGTAFLIVGILGFVPGVTDKFEGLKFAGHRATAELFGVFAVSILHNVLTIVIGLAGLELARRRSGARAWLLGAGALCLALWVFGLSVGRNDSANFIPLNSADNWLDFGVGVVLVGAGLLLGRQAPHQKEAVSAT
jgi:arginine exporter protein ArgO